MKTCQELKHSSTHSSLRYQTEVSGGHGPVTLRHSREDCSLHSSCESFVEKWYPNFTFYGPCIV